MSNENEIKDAVNKVLTKPDTNKTLLDSKYAVNAALIGGFAGWAFAAYSQGNKPILIVVGALAGVLAVKMFKK